MVWLSWPGQLAKAAFVPPVDLNVRLANSYVAARWPAAAGGTKTVQVMSGVTP